MVDMTAIGVIATSLNTIVNITKAMKDVQDATLIQSKVFELQGVIIETQQSVFAANTERTVLVDKISELETKIASLEAWETEKQRYELKEIGNGSLAYTVKESMCGTEPVHHICANCYQHGRKSILQSRFEHPDFILYCWECKDRLFVGVGPSRGGLIFG
jgi:hypothetical protein